MVTIPAEVPTAATFSFAIIASLIWRDFGIDFGPLSARNGPETPKKGKNRAVPVTDKLTMHFCIVFILLCLHEFHRRKQVKSL
jgi:hypothetical protein